MDAAKNFAYGTVLTAPSPASSGTSLVLQSGQGALCPAVPFNATVWPTGAIPLASNAEIVRVTAIVGDTLTITRAQEGSSARAIVAGDQFAATITAKFRDDVWTEPVIIGPMTVSEAPGFSGLTVGDDAGFANWWGDQQWALGGHAVIAASDDPRIFGVAGSIRAAHPSGSLAVAVASAFALDTAAAGSLVWGAAQNVTAYHVGAGAVGEFIGQAIETWQDSGTGVITAHIGCWTQQVVHGESTTVIGNEIVAVGAAATLVADWYGFRLTNNFSAPPTIARFYGLHMPELSGLATDAHYAWFNSDGVLRVHEDAASDSPNAQATFHLHNPRATKYTAGSPNYESGTMRWVNNVFQIGAVAAGSGTLRDLQLLGASLALPGPTTITGAVGSSALTITGGTQTASYPALNLTQTWNNAATTFYGAVLDITTTDYATQSVLVMVRRSGVDKWFLQTGLPGGSTQVAMVMPTDNNNGFWLAASHLKAGPGWQIDWSDGSIERTSAGITDLTLARDAAGVLAIRNSTNAQALHHYGRYVSASNRNYLAIRHATTTLTSVTGASVTATSLIPAGAIVLGVSTRVTTALGTGSGTTGYQVGDGSDADRWGTVTGTATTTKTTNANWTVATVPIFVAANNVVITANGGNFDGTGAIYIDISYAFGDAD